MGLFSLFSTGFSKTLYIFFLVYMEEKALIYVFHAKPFLFFSKYEMHMHTLYLYVKFDSNHSVFSY